MFTIPSIWNIIISTIVFVIAAWYIRRYLESQGLPKSITRGLLVFILAYAISYGSGELVDWTQEKIYGPEPVSQTQQELNELLNASGIALP
jgi:predicted PurR-regulated permease PerM